MTGSKNTFLILGRPRSRTAWLANFFTQPNISFCYHEALSSHLPTELAFTLHQHPHHVGNAGTDVLIDPIPIISTINPTHLVILTGRPTSWQSFQRKHDIPQEVVDHVEEAYQSARKHYKNDAIFFDFHETSDETAFKRLYNALIPDNPFPIQRYRLLRDLNVQVNPGGGL